MKQIKLSGFQKLVCLSLAAILCIAILGFAVSGTQQNNSKIPSADNSQNQNDANENGDNNPPPFSDSNNPSTDTVTPPNNDVNITPPANTKYINQLTGIEISKEQYNTTPIATVVNPNAALYGISNSDMVIEFPTESGATRLLVYSTATDVLWKIGALLPTRDFITDMSVFFGGIVVSFGDDDNVIYDAWETNAFLIDVSKYSDCYFVENTLFVYTTHELINRAKEKNDLKEANFLYNTAPYDFINNDVFVGTGECKALTIPYKNNATEFYYHEASRQYLYYKSGTRKADMLTGKNISFKNIFVLFADTTTYEKSDGIELVVDVYSGGKGYYISEGTCVEFMWQTDKANNLSFFSLNGEKLKVNPGNCYVSYYKSSNTSDVLFS